MSINHKLFDSKTFVSKELDVDGKSFVNCTFKQCVFVYSGGNPPVINGCSFDNCRWKFAAAAARTLGFFSGMHSGGFDKMVEATFHEVRKGGTFANVPAVGSDDKSPKPDQTTVFGFKPPRILKISKNRK